MKLIVIGLGRGGGKIADEFAKLNKRARTKRGLEIITETFAVDTDPEDLISLRAIKPDPHHRILIESQKTDGNDLVKMSEIGAGIITENSNRVLEAVRTARRLFETDAFLLIAGVSGSTGSGGMPVMAHSIKECYKDKAVYSLVLLPFQDEEAEEERTPYNAAISLKTIYSVANAVFVADNQHFVNRDSTLRDKVARINEMIVEPFYDLLCAGEEEKSQYVGSSMATAGNIMHTLAGWTAIGYGKSPLSPGGLFGRWRSFRSKSADKHAGIQAIEAAISRMPVDCQPADAENALYLVLAPTEEVNVEIFQELGTYLKGVASGATIRSCDYPRGRGVMNVTVILSGLSSVERIKGYYDKVGSLMRQIKMRQAEAESRAKAMEAASKKIPSLL